MRHLMHECVLSRPVGSRYKPVRTGGVAMGVAVGIACTVVCLVSNHSYFLVICLYVRAYVRYMLLRAQLIHSTHTSNELL